MDQVEKRPPIKPRFARRYWRNLALFTLVALVIAAGVEIVLLARQAASNYLHPPRLIRPAEETPALFGIAYQEITLHTSDGLQLAAWYTPSPNGAVILVGHGIAGGRSATMHALFARHGYGVVSWDFRAHGASEGELCTVGYNEVLDVEAALQFARTQPDVQHIGIWGGSMGAVTAIRAAARHPDLEAVVADSAFTSLTEELNTIVYFPPLRPLIRFFAEREAGVRLAQVSPVDDIKSISPRPIFLIQGGADTIVPPHAAERLYTAAGEPRSLWLAPGAAHLAASTVYPDEYERRVCEFFDAALLQSAHP